MPPPTTTTTTGGGAIFVRHMSSSSPDDGDDGGGRKSEVGEESGDDDDEDDSAEAQFYDPRISERHSGIILNPKSTISNRILPGELLIKTNKRTGVKKTVPIDREMGYFWSIKDLGETDGKPLLTNAGAIDISRARDLPSLSSSEEKETSMMGGGGGGGGRCETLGGTMVQDLYDFVTSQNRELSCAFVRVASRFAFFRPRLFFPSFYSSEKIRAH